MSPRREANEGRYRYPDMLYRNRYINRYNISEEEMTKQQAVKQGWDISGSGNDVTAEKGRFIFMGTLALVLKMIEKTGT